MKTRTKRLQVLLLAAGIALAGAVWAGCKQDCAGDLEAALRGCQVNYKQDPANLKDCQENAQRDYQACLEDCGA